MNRLKLGAALETCYNAARAMSPRCMLVGVALSLVIAVPRAARASDFYGRLFAGPAYIHNDDVSGRDSSGFGIAAQVDLGARLWPELALHATVLADHSQTMAFSDSSDGDYETTVVGLGLGATASWRGLSLGAAGGAQLTWHPDALNPNDGSEGAGLGPFVSTTLGYGFNASRDVQIGAHGLARYRVGKDAVDPSGYQLGLGLSVSLLVEAADAVDGADPSGRVNDSVDERPSPGAAPSEPGPAVAAVSAQIGWWNAELEVLVSPGAYVAVGGPWVAALLGPSEDRLILPFGARVGYQVDIGGDWNLRAATHLVGLHGSAGQCLDCDDDAYGTDSWLLFELGFRNGSSSGFVYGIDLPLLLVHDVLGLDNDFVERDIWFPPLSLVFLQVYVGHSWLL